MKKIITFIGFFIVILFHNNIAEAQFMNSGPDGDPKIAVVYYDFENYEQSIIEYEKLCKRDSTVLEWRYNLGISYLKSYVNKAKSISHLYYVCQQEDADENAFYDLGLAYMYNYRYNDAIKAFQEFEKNCDNDVNFLPASFQIQQCISAKKILKDTLNVSINNLGKTFNSKLPDYSAYTNKDESHIFFSSRRQGNTGNVLDYNGSYTSDIYYSEYKYNKWKKAKRYSAMINTPYTEEVAGYSYDGNKLFVFVDNEAASNKIMMSTKKGRAFSYPQALSREIYENSIIITTACISNDEQTLFFGCEGSHPGAMGGIDIYMSKKIANGKWDTPVNLGPNINTKYDDDFPSLSFDGNTLYFASNGHSGLGGYDIYYSTFNNKTKQWSKPTNIGYPINTPFNNMTISFTETGRYAYISTYMPENTIGDLDIYRVIFNDVDPKYSIINFNLFDADSNKIFTVYNNRLEELNKLKKEIIFRDSILDSNKDTVIEEVKIPDYPSDLKVKITVVNKKDNKIYGVYRPNTNNSKAIAILAPGEYKYTIKSEIYADYSAEFSIIERDNRNLNVNYIIKLKNK